jgi:hypothetical protein
MNALPITERNRVILWLMKKFYARICFAIFLSISAFARAEEPSAENNLNEIRKLCVHDKKPKDVCGCLVKNLDNKFHNGQFGEKQLGDAVAAAKHLPDAPDYVADLMTGLEYHCMENTNYSE